jgi:hypothetical protein
MPTLKLALPSSDQPPPPKRTLWQRLCRLVAGLAAALERLANARVGY